MANALFDISHARNLMHLVSMILVRCSFAPCGRWQKESARREDEFAGCFEFCTLHIKQFSHCAGVEHPAAGFCGTLQHAFQPLVNGFLQEDLHVDTA